ncbi:mitochondrial ribosomal protein L42 [Arctopsyche grandis]|uniref:mitochondrial ribosomal protein L42 n=1 Tax=Arctopsyche grandis TaxID=121162 RepID=UPI00406D79C1
MQCLSGLYRLVGRSTSSAMLVGRRGYAINHLTVTDDGTTAVALHPETNLNVPYDDTQPMPMPMASVDSINDSPLRLRPEQARKVFITENVEEGRRQLAKLTLTTIHKWYPRSRDRRAKKTPMDRRYL